jgi:hypothetical protein
MKKTELKSFVKEEILNEMALQEMAKIKGDLKSSIEKVIKDNPDLETLPLKKAIKADDDVKAALGDQTLYDNQLGKFISAAKGEREIGKRGRKADPNKPKKEPSGKGRGRPKSTKKKDSVATTSKLGGRKYYTKKTDGDTDGPTDAELRKLARSGGSIGKSKSSTLKQQTKAKLVKDFLKDLKSKGIVDKSNKILDKAKYDAAWAEEKPKIQSQINQVNESFPEDPSERKLIDYYIGVLDNLKQDFPSDGQIQARTSTLIGNLLDYING